MEEIKSSDYIQKKAKKSLKWSTFGEIIGKLITPITTAILSRILAPEIFGITTTMTMVVSFCEIFTDGGFSKYIIQASFKDDTETKQALNVSFWSNFILSILFFICICFFSKPISNFVGNAGYELALIIACIQIPIAAFTSIQTALFRREFLFKKLFYHRVITAILNLIISVPLALLGLSYWAIIIGNLVSSLFGATLLFFTSSWKPKIYFNFAIFKKMFSFSFWNLVESVIIWLCAWSSSFIISNKMNAYYLGIYKNSISMINSLFGIVTSSILPVLFSSLSRLKDDDDAFNNVFYKMQKLVGFIIIPLGTGLFLYRDLATMILFGSQWGDAAIVIGIAGLPKILVIIFSNFASEVYRAKSKPIISTIVQAISLAILIPACLLTSDKDFSIYVLTSSLANLSLVISSFFFLRLYFKIKLSPIFKNILPPLVCSIIMFCCSYGLQQLFHGYWWDLISIIICVIIYFGIYYIFFYKDLKNIISYFFKKRDN